MGEAKQAQPLYNPATMMSKPRLSSFRTSTIRNVILLCIFLVGVHLIFTSGGSRGGVDSAKRPVITTGGAAVPAAAAVPYAEQVAVGGAEDRFVADGHQALLKNVTERPRAAFVVLARNSDLKELRPTIREMEDRFNRNHHYDWVFLNDQPWTDEFIEYTKTLVSSKAKYGVIPKEHWSYPPHIDEPKADAARKKMEEEKIIYGGSLPYRHMCRYNSGFFYRHELLKDYEFYWRVEPGVKYHCDMMDDPFAFMKRTGKKYGFTIALYEYEKTIPTLWDTTKEFMKAHPEHMPEGNALDFISNDGGETYNRCHFWSNFEIASLDFWRSKAYSDYFEHLDKAGGFFYERWGDAPVHSIAAALFLKKEDIHFFNDIGYFHAPFSHCPKEKELQHRCVCDVTKSFDDNSYSCLPRWKQVASK